MINAFGLNEPELLSSLRSSESRTVLNALERLERHSKRVKLSDELRKAIQEAWVFAPEEFETVRPVRQRSLRLLGLIFRDDGSLPAYCRILYSNSLACEEREIVIASIGVVTRSDSPFASPAISVLADFALNSANLPRLRKLAYIEVEHSFEDSSESDYESKKRGDLERIEINEERLKPIADSPAPAYFNENAPIPEAQLLRWLKSKDPFYVSEALAHIGSKKRTWHLTPAVREAIQRVWLFECDDEAYDHNEIRNDAIVLLGTYLYDTESYPWFARLLQDPEVLSEQLDSLMSGLKKVVLTESKYQGDGLQTAIEVALDQRFPSQIRKRAYLLVELAKRRIDHKEYSDLTSQALDNVTIDEAWLKTLLDKPESQKS
jgi:hypothetical protein